MYPCRELTPFRLMHEPQHTELVADSSGQKATRESHSNETLKAAASGARATDGLSPTSLAAFKLYLILFVPSMASVVVGYDISVMNYINGMEPYLSYFGLDGQDGGGGVGTTTALIFGMAPVYNRYDYESVWLFWLQVPCAVVTADGKEWSGGILL
ncbi:MFS domain-containing protein [Mycena venus]|uniref:MFS domain-containing protein n=1 Tax=Mycena venus TaxID=2733690 RepID=A0A8H7DAT2_9AGAR|nr:MFS domain-containing protein [Mycena venus]